MGGLLSFLFASNTSAEHINDPSLDIPDPKTNLTPRQKKVIQENWALVQKDIRGNGVDFFIRFFEHYPDYQKAFKSFANVPRDQLRTNKKLHAHAFSVMYAVSSMVENLEDIDCLLVILVKTGQNHVKHSISMKQFEHLAVVFVDFLGEKLGSAFTPYARLAWQKAFEVINSVIKTGMEKPDQ